MSGSGLFEACNPSRRVRNRPLRLFLSDASVRGAGQAQARVLGQSVRTAKGSKRKQKGKQKCHSECLFSRMKLKRAGGLAGSRVVVLCVLCVFRGE